MTVRPDALALLIGLATGLATVCGGLAALRLRRASGAFLGFSSGAVLGVALFDLLPEALQLGQAAQPPLAMLSATAVGLLIYLALDRLPAALTAGGDRLRSVLGPASLTAHSLMDGLGIGLALHVSVPAGMIVAAAVLAHDFVDGANTVMLSFAGGAGSPAARRWLAADALAPLAGIAIARTISIAPDRLALLLATFAGFFLYIGAAELLPRSRTDTTPVRAVAAFVLGLAVIWLVVRAAG